jgi:hypothetical protein
LNRDGLKPAQVSNIQQPPFETLNEDQLKELMKQNQPVDPIEGLKIWKGFKCSLCGKMSNDMYVLKSKSKHECTNRQGNLQLHQVYIQRLSKKPAFRSWFQVSVFESQPSGLERDIEEMYDEVSIGDGFITHCKMFGDENELEEDVRSVDELNRYRGWEKQIPLETQKQWSHLCSPPNAADGDLRSAYKYVMAAVEKYFLVHAKECLDRADSTFLIELRYEPFICLIKPDSTIMIQTLDQENILNSLKRVPPVLRTQNILVYLCFFCYD